MKRHGMLDFFTLASREGLTHHSPRNIELYLDRVLFDGMDFRDRRVLDIGGGRGLCSFYAAWKGAKLVHNVEPLLDGSNNADLEAFASIRSTHGLESAEFVSRKIQQHLEECGKYDVVVMHDSVNHLDEQTYSRLHQSEEARTIYRQLFSRIRDRIESGGLLVATDCSRYNFFGALGMRSPFAPAIDWSLHQPPGLLARLLQEAGFSQVRYSWTPIKRLGRMGLWIAGLGAVSAYFLQSHFVIRAKA